MAAQTQQRPAATGRWDRTSNNSQPNSTITANPLQLLLSAHEQTTGHRERKSGNGYTITCAKCATASRKVSVTQWPNGSIGFHAFCGCATHDVLAAMGLTMASLFQHRDLRTMTPAERSQMRQAALLPKWKAALAVLETEATVLLIAADKLADGNPLSEEDRTRLIVAALKVFDAGEVLNAR